MGFEFKTGSMKDRLRGIEEAGYMMGVNGAGYPSDVNAVIGRALYGGDERAASDRYMVARFREQWYIGEQEYIKSSGRPADVTEFKKMKECFDDMKLINEAFRLGEEYRYNGRSAVWIADRKLFGIMDGRDDRFGQLCVDAWIAGWHFMDEEISLDRVVGKPKKVLYRVNADKMTEFEKYREAEGSPEEGEAVRYFDAYCEAADRLSDRGDDDLIGCLTCPYMYRGLGVTIEDAGRADWCDADCAYVSGVLEDCCGKLVRTLSGYFVEKVEEEEE